MHRCLLAFALVALIPASMQAAGPVCALLAPDMDSRAALLEAKLLADTGSTWIERTNVAAILKEQKLQSTFGPQGVGDRVKLGRLLKADLLVLVRPVKDAKEPALEVVVSETAGGLRLLVRSVPFSKDAESDVAALLVAVRAGIRKHGETIRDVVAVPPFVSENLGYEFELLKGAFAKLTESAALNREGIVVVELEEAEAVAKEIALATPGAKVVRLSPLYLIGAFRHEGRAADRTVALKLRVERGGKPVGKHETLSLKADAAPDGLRKWAAGVLDDAGGEVVALPDPRTEAKRLGEMATIHQRLGDWPNAMALIEASLLLEPKHPQLNADAMVILRYWLDEALRNGRSEPMRGLTRAAQLQRRGVAHMESLIVSGAQLPSYKRYTGPTRVFESTFPFPKHPPLFGSSYVPPPDPPEINAIIVEAEKERQAAYLRMLPLAVKDGTDREVIPLVEVGIGILPVAEYSAELGKLILKHQDSSTEVRVS